MAILREGEVNLHPSDNGVDKERHLRVFDDSLRALKFKYPGLEKKLTHISPQITVLREDFNELPWEVSWIIIQILLWEEHGPKGLSEVFGLNKNQTALITKKLLDLDDPDLDGPYKGQVEKIIIELDERIFAESLDEEDEE